MKTSLIYLSLSADGSSLRSSTLNGITYLIAPVISKVGDRVEWPANAPTPELIPADVLTFATDSRNNRPVVMGHPMRNGEYTSANDPEILERYCFGYVFNASFSDTDKKVSCEIWLDPLRAVIVDSHLGGSHAQRVIERLQDGQTVEVSEGNYVVLERVSGTYNDKEYGGIWRLCIGDHLAVLNENQIGACSIEDGCGALRMSKGLNGSSWYYPVLTPITPSLSISILSQARRPTFSGTETSSWSAPSFSEYVRYLHEGKDGPTSVSQCDSSLKRLISAHSLLGDPDGNNLSDLTFFPCVNPSNGKLNEKALRSIIGSRGSTADIDEKAKISAQDMARRLLNSEFGVELSTSTSISEDEISGVTDMDQKKESFFKRLISSMAEVIRSSMSNNDLRQKLYKALHGTVRGLSYVYDEDVAEKTVKYCIFIKYGDSYLSEDYEYRFYQRTFDIDGNDNVTVNDDPTEIERYEDGWRPVTTEPSTTEESIIVSDDKVTLETEPQPCSCNHNKGESTMDRKAVISRICSASTIWKKNVKALEVMDDDALMTVSQEVEEDKKENEKEEKEKVVVTPPATPSVTAPDPPPTSNLESISASELATLKVQAAKFQQAENAHRTSLIGKLVTSSAFTEDRLKTMATDDLETLSKSLKLEDSSVPPQYDFSGRGISFMPGTETKSHKAPDTWAISASEHAKKTAN